MKNDTIIFKKSRGIAVFLVMIFFTLVSTPKAHADIWGGAIYASILKQTMETITKQIEGALLGTLKVAAIELLNTQVGQLIGGGPGAESRIITSYEDFLKGVPEEYAYEVTLGDMVGKSLRGRGSSANYLGAGNTGSLKGDYNAYLKKTIIDTLEGKRKNEVTPNNYAECSAGNSDPRIGIREGDFRAISCLFERPANNPIGIALLTAAAYEENLADKRFEQEIAAQSSGFKPVVDKDGNIITAAGTVESLVSDVQNLGNNIIAAANNPGEFLSGVVVSVVNRTVSNVIRKGTGEIQGKIRREIRNVDNQISRKVYKFQETIGPGAVFIDELEQRTRPQQGDTPTVPFPGGADGIY